MEEITKNIPEMIILLVIWNFLVDLVTNFSIEVAYCLWTARNLILPSSYEPSLITEASFGWVTPMPRDPSEGGIQSYFFGTTTNILVSGHL